MPRVAERQPPRQSKGNRHFPELKDDKDLRAAAKAFILAVQRAVVRSREHQSEVLRGGGGYRWSPDRLIDTAICRKEEQALVSRCIKLLGPSVAHDDDVERLAWECADQATLSSQTLDPSAFFEDFAVKAEQWRAQPVRYLIPNLVVELVEGTSALKVGRVSVRRTNEVVCELKTARVNAEQDFDIEVGVPGQSIIGDRRVFGMTPTCWDVMVPASPGIRSESARWMIDVAISLIRLSRILGDSPVEPLLGQVEAKSDGPLYHPSTDITVTTGTNFSVRSQRPLGLYVFDGATADPDRVKALDRRGRQIFDASPGSVAERVQQGLGWLTRARTSYDRPERFLYFFTALEALLSSDDKSAPVVQTIARHAAVLLTNDIGDRVRIAIEIRKLYEVRSALVHKGKRGVSTNSAVNAEHIVECLFYRVLEADKLEMKHQAFEAELAEASYGLDWPCIRREASPEPEENDAFSSGT